MVRKYVTLAPQAAPHALTNALGELYQNSVDIARLVRHVLEPLLQFLPLPLLAWMLHP